MSERLWTPGGPQDFAHVDPDWPPNYREKRAMMRQLRAFRRRAARERDNQARQAKKPRRPSHPGVRCGLPTPEGKISEWIRDRRAYIWLN